MFLVHVSNCSLHCNILILTHTHMHLLSQRVFGIAPGAGIPSMLSRPVPAAYWCSAGCGGGLSNITNGTIYYYNYGTCEAQDHCVCKPKPGTDEPGYAGSSCQQILCDPQCRNGECTQYVPQYNIIQISTN